jgi:hypothetical protein
MTRSRWFTVAAAVLACGRLGWTLWGRRDGVEAFEWTMSWSAVVGAAAMLAVAPFVQALSFRILLAELGAQVATLPAAVVWMRSFLLRYAPSGVLGIAYRIRAGERIGASPAQVGTATVYEQLIVLAAGAIACATGFMLASSHPPAVAVAILVVALVLLSGLRPAWGGRLVRPFLRRRGIDVPALVRG